MAEFTITKKYSRKVSLETQAGAWHSWDFETELSRTVTANSAEELMNESSKLFNQAKGLTDTDIESTLPEIKEQTGATNG